MKKIMLLLFIVPGFLMLSAQNKKVVYKESFEDFPNPERGFYIPSEGNAGHFAPLQEDRLKAMRAAQQPGLLSLRLANTLIYRGFLLDSFKNTPISADYLEKIDRDFSTIRSAGVKAIVRFAYTNTSHTGTCPDEYKICPPYGDAPLQIVLQHIAQLKPLLQKNADVIAAMQMGFIGIWGENYFTDYFGDASTNGLARVLDSSWRDRNLVLKALLDALPKDRMIQVRTPQMKQRYVYGPSATVNSPALKEEESFSGSDQSRIALHNDCFLSSVDDYGTFYDYGNSSSPRGPANDVLRKYFIEDSKYVAVGGETCDNTFSPQNDCEPAGHAETEMRSMHYSFLNAGYNMAVIKDWQKGGCIDSIKRSLGYRLVLRYFTSPSKIVSGEPFTFSIGMVNKGYASPFNPRQLMLVLRNQVTKKEYTVNCAANVQKWFTGEHVITGKVSLPQQMEPGKYELLLNMPDIYPSLAHRPEYSIRLANEDTWEPETGYNDLKTEIAIVDKQAH